MAYREDKDLEFLGQMSSTDLNDLVDCLIKDKDGKLRLTEELTTNEFYKNNHPNHTKYWQEIAAEIQCFGANSLVIKDIPSNSIAGGVPCKVIKSFNEKFSIVVTE